MASRGDQPTQAAPAGARAPAGPGAPPRDAPRDPAALLRQPAYLRLLALAAILGAPISAAAYGFLALSSYLQKELYTHLPHGLGFASVPVWWPLPMLLVGGVLAGLAIRYLPGGGGPSPAGGFKMHPPPTAVQLPGIVLAALATLAFGAALGPEMPLILIGGGLATLVTKLRRMRQAPPQAVRLVGSAGSFAAISTLLGSPITGAFLLMEASGLGGAMLDVALLPGLVASGVGALIFIGLDSLTGLGTFALTLPGLPHFSRPNGAEFGWAIVIGLAAAVIGPAIHRLGLFLHGYATRRPLLAAPLAGAVVAVIAIIYTEVTGKPSSDVLFSGQTAMGTVVGQASAYSVGALVLLVACKGLAYGVSLSAFRGGPVFPALFIGATGGIAMSHLPGLSLVPAVAMGIAAMGTVMLTLPLTSVLLASLLVGADAVAAMPLVIIAAAVAYVAAARLTPRPASPAGQASPPSPAGKAPASAARQPGSERPVPGQPAPSGQS